MSIISQPVITEKSLAAATNGKYSFAVKANATKPEIAKAVAKLYSVVVTKVHVQSIIGHNVRQKTGLGKQKDWKKAIVTLKAGQVIKDFEFPQEEKSNETKTKAKKKE